MDLTIWENWGGTFIENEEKNSFISFDHKKILGVNLVLIFNVSDL
jgi:hypothetical protein